jgi:hypothetical protein
MTPEAVERGYFEARSAFCNFRSILRRDADWKVNCRGPFMSLDFLVINLFSGRDAHISDRFGEKLNERHVRQALDGVLTSLAVRPMFAMVACDEASNRHAYTLFIEAPGQPDDALSLLGDELEKALLENYHYGYCRDLSQLDAVRVFRVESGALEVYLSVCQAHGQRLGDIKPIALHRLGVGFEPFEGGFWQAMGARG